MSANTAISGIEGAVTLPTGHSLRVRAWSADILQSVNDVTGFAQQPWAANIGGLRVLRGKCSGYIEKGAANNAPGGAASAAGGGSFVLTAATNCTLSFTGIVSNVSYGDVVDGVPTGMIDFVSTGTVTEAWA